MKNLFDDLFSHARSHPMTCGITVDVTASGQRRAHAHFEQSARGSFTAQELPGGLVLSVLDGQVLRDIQLVEGEQEEYAPPLSISVVLTGRSVLRMHGGRLHTTRPDGDLWHMVGAPGVLESTMLTGAFRTCHIGLSRPLLERWLQSLTHDGNAQRRIAAVLEGQEPQGLSFQSLPAGMAHTARCLHALHARSAEEPAQPLTFGQCLQAEGFALTLLGQWLELPGGTGTCTVQHKRLVHAVDAALDIVRAEYASALSISALAQRVGTNECYLKRAFRERTGMGIAQYIREQRMNTALALLENGRLSVNQVAQHVGYQSMGHFAHAFREQHGYLPSQVRQ
ncbi:helix-turn-helix transcriptional regulator [Ottowia testudinis]|uniref:Helix-turn-helix transcriptional regulator n=1 Tax=Ottowia testudinis TaxID=2816950 RepID=A0A975CJ39_9BURK|nr:AraC family transcriptional regulator [Ottowia testudinis]QTD44353.1 helix-turn-helix transcriptional regulator [Ottowia testudinis]